MKSIEKNKVWKFNFNTYIKRILIFILLSFISIFIFLFITYKEYIPYYLKKTNYLPYKFRKSYIINDIDNENLLKNYVKDDKNLIIFWASWCKYCVMETNALNNFILNNPDKNIIIVSHDNKKEDLEKYLTDNNLNWLVILDTDKLIRESLDPESTGIPSSYLVNKNLHVLNYYKGDMTTEQFGLFYDGVKIDKDTNEIQEPIT